MMFLKKFWSGDIAPGEGRYHTSEEYVKSYKTMERCEGCCDNFIDGFRMGAFMMMDVLMAPGNS